MITRRAKVQVKISMERLREDKEALANFLTEDPRVKKILGSLLRAVDMHNKISIVELANVLFIEAIDNKKSWLTKDPDDVYAYLEETVRNYLIGHSSSTFFRTYFGYDSRLGKKVVSLDAKKAEDGRSLEERIPSPNTGYDEEESEMTAEEKLACFKNIIKLVADKKADYGELLDRYYIRQEKMRDIAVDFLRRGIIGKRRYKDNELTEKIIDDAEKNLQNAKISRARDKFNAIALSEKVNLRLEGKIKKSLLKTINTATL